MKILLVLDVLKKRNQRIHELFAETLKIPSEVDDVEIPSLARQDGPFHHVLAIEGPQEIADHLGYGPYDRACGRAWRW